MLSWFAYLFPLALSIFVSSCSKSYLRSSKMFQSNNCEIFLENQRIFEEKAFEAVKKAGLGKKSFDEINAEFAAVRRSIQEEQKHPVQSGNVQHFGQPRTVELETKLTFKSGPYQGGFNRIAAQMEVIDTDQKQGTTRAQLRSLPGSNHLKTKHYGFLVNDPNDDRNMLVLTKFERSEQSTITMVHTSPNYLERVMPIVRQKYRQALDSSQKSEVDIIKSIGEFHWWYAHATPFTRGSASIGEMHAASLFRYHNIKGLTLNNLRSFYPRQKIHLDVWALTTGDPIEFATRYEMALRFRYQVPRSLQRLPDRAK